MSAAEPELGNEVWQAGDEAPRPEEALVVSLDGFAGPLDVLLALARTQKVDLAKISVLALAEQYLGFIAHARKLRLELAADYLVMAAWLAYLKSKLLLPREPSTARSALGRGAGGTAGLPPEAAGGHAQRGRHPDDAASARPRRFRTRHAGRGAHHPRAPVHCRRIRPAQGLRRAALAYGQAGACCSAPHGLVDQGRARAAAGADRSRDGASGCNSRCTSSSICRARSLARTALASSFGATLEMARDGLVELSQAEPLRPSTCAGARKEQIWQRVS